ncbi:uncharacterized protein LOC135398200 isoform X2 [Ornithodoros turicata]|uniref:uncharacterized protein LOC135398200 isoform X2 n=1 Tax=Ornithodoros turicata TaxID=34597 RepID=UPI003139DDE1
MVRLTGTFVVALVAYLQFLSPVSGAISCSWDMFSASCTNYKRLKYKGRHLTCSYMCALSIASSCYKVETAGSDCWMFDGYATNGLCVNGTCVPVKNATEYFKTHTPNTTLKCGHGHDYLYDQYGPFGCQYYCSDNGRPANRPDNITCQMPQTAARSTCDSSGYCSGTVWIPM